MKVLNVSSGSPLREFLHVDDLGEASVFALENWQPGIDEIQFLNVGTGTILIRELANIVAKSVGFKGEITWDIQTRWNAEKTIGR